MPQRSPIANAWQTVARRSRRTRFEIPSPAEKQHLEQAIRISNESEFPGYDKAVHNSMQRRAPSVVSHASRQSDKSRRLNARREGKKEAQVEMDPGGKHHMGVQSVRSSAHSARSSRKSAGSKLGSMEYEHDARATSARDQMERRSLKKARKKQLKVDNRKAKEALRDSKMITQLFGAGEMPAATWDDLPVQVALGLFRMASAWLAKYLRQYLGNELHVVYDGFAQDDGLGIWFRLNAFHAAHNWKLARNAKQVFLKMKMDPPVPGKPNQCVFETWADFKARGMKQIRVFNQVRMPLRHGGGLEELNTDDHWFEKLMDIQLMPERYEKPLGDLMLKMSEYEREHNGVVMPLVDMELFISNRERDFAQIFEKEAFMRPKAGHSRKRTDKRTTDKQAGAAAQTPGEGMEEDDLCYLHNASWWKKNLSRLKQGSTRHCNKNCNGLDGVKNKSSTRNARKGLFKRSLKQQAALAWSIGTPQAAMSARQAVDLARGASAHAATGASAGKSTDWNVGVSGKLATLCAKMKKCKRCGGAIAGCKTKCTGWMFNKVQWQGGGHEPGKSCEGWAASLNQESAQAAGPARADFEPEPEAPAAAAAPVAEPVPAPAPAASALTNAHAGAAGGNAAATSTGALTEDGAMIGALRTVLACVGGTSCAHADQQREQCVVADVHDNGMDDSLERERAMTGASAAATQDPIKGDAERAHPPVLCSNGSGTGRESPQSGLLGGQAACSHALMREQALELLLAAQGEYPSDDEEEPEADCRSIAEQACAGQHEAEGEQAEGDDEAKAQLTAGAEADVAGSQMGRNRQAAADRGAWSIQMVKHPTLAEVLEHPATLFLIPKPFCQSRDDLFSVWEPWTMGGTSHLEVAKNTAVIRLPQVRCEKGETIVLGKEAMEFDFATAYARMNESAHVLLGVPEKLMQMVTEFGAGEVISPCVHALFSKHTAKPDFMEGRSASELVAAHNERVSACVSDLHLLSLLCGVGGAALACRASGIPERNFHLFEVCPEHCAQLELRFPEAHVYCLDIRSQEAEDAVMDLEGKKLLGIGAIPCQAGSDACRAEDRHEDDHRMLTGCVALELFAKVGCEAIVLEDVASFKANQPVVFEKVDKRLRQVLPQVKELYLNGKHCMLAQQRNRLFLTGAKRSVDLSKLVEALQVQNKLYKDGIRTGPTMREALSPYLDLRKYSGVFIPSLSHALKGADGRPQRVISLDRPSPTITGNYGVKGGLSDQVFARYKCCDADEALKNRTINLSPALWGVLNGFSIHAPYSTARRCDCVGCGSREGKCRGTTPAEKEVGNAIAPPMGLFIMQHLVRAVDRAILDAGAAAVADVRAGGVPPPVEQAVDLPGAPAIDMQPEAVDLLRAIHEHCVTDGDDLAPTAQQRALAKMAIALIESTIEQAHHVRHKLPWCVAAPVDTGTASHGGVVPLGNDDEESAACPVAGEGDDEQLADEESAACPVAGEGDDEQPVMCACACCGSDYRLTDEDAMLFMASLGVTPSLDNDSLGGTDAERKRSLEFLRSSLRLSPTIEEARAATTGANESGSALLGVTDEEAQRYLRLTHQRLAHASLRYIKQLHRSGDIMAPFDVSEAQFDCCQFHCPTCARTRQTRKPTVTNRRKPPAALRVLQEVVVDVEGPRRVPSLHYYKGDKGNQSGGGNLYTTYYLDRATERLFTSFVRTKDELLGDVKAMRAHMTIEARQSMHYDGQTDLEVGTFVSDRDPNLTSNEAVAYMLGGRIKHLMTAADAKNQTPGLDNVMRRVCTMARALLDDSGLTIEYWQFAVEVATAIYNLFPTSRHRLHHSPMRRWTGKVQDLNLVRTFGADAYPLQPGVADKLEAVAPGGEGLYRYVGPAKGVGNESKGSLIFNTDTKRVRVMKHFELNENMDEVRELPLPVAAWPEAGDLKGGATGDPEMEGFMNSDPAKAPEKGSVIEPTVEGDEPIDRAVPAPAPTVKGDIPIVTPGPLRSDERIRMCQVNPKRKGSASRGRYEKYKSAQTVREYLSLGGSRADIRHDERHGFLVRVREDWSAGYVQPPAALSKKHEHISAQWDRDCVLKYEGYAHSFAAWQERSDIANLANAGGVDAREDLQPFWEGCMTATFERRELESEPEPGEPEPERGKVDGVESAFGCVNSLATEFAQWSRIEDNRGALVELEELARQVFCGMGDRHFVHMAHEMGNLVEGLEHLRASEVKVPRSYKEAIRGEFAKYWKEAIEREITNLRTHGVFEWVKRPPGKHLIDSNWAWKVKTNDKGQCSKFKSRLVGRGFRQLYGIDFLDTMAPVAKLTSFRVLVAEAARRGMEVSFCDIRSAYLTADLKVKQYMTPPQGVSPPEPGMVMRLDRALYGLRQSARVWHSKFQKDLLSWGYTPSSADPCLFIRRRGSSVIRVLLFVDDMAIFSDSDVDGRAMRDELVSQIKEAGYEYSTSDDQHVYLGMAVHKINDTAYFLTQERYVEDVMIKYEIVGRKGVRTTAPSGAGKVTVRDCAQCEPKDNLIGRKFREICGVLRWIEQCTRPDISATLSELSKVQLNPGPVHMERLMHLMRYVNTTKHLGLLYGGKKVEMANGLLVGYVDSDWAGDPDTMYSRGGWLYSCWQTPVCWASYKMKAVAASSCEAEYMSASLAVRQAKWLGYLLSDMGYGNLRCTEFGSLCDRDFVKAQLSDLVDVSESTILCMGDNKAAIAIARNPVLHKRSKHIKISYHLTRYEVKKGTIHFAYIPSAHNVADLLTKSLTRVPHEHILSKIMCFKLEGQMCGIDGKPLRLPCLAAVQDALYAVEPKGLSPSYETVPVVDMSDKCEIDMNHEEEMEEQRFAEALGAFCEVMMAWIAGNVSELSPELVKSLEEAIVDSGASFSYVTKNVPLSEAKTGTGAVWTADGQRSAIAQIGNAGPLHGVKRVDSFTRPLISVSELSAQFGGVYFDSEEVYVVSRCDGSIIATSVGRRNAAHLYTFDVQALADHQAKLLQREIKSGDARQLASLTEKS